MKKLILIFCMFFVQKTYAQLSTISYNGEEYLGKDGQFFTGSRGAALDLERVNPRQPLEKDLMVLHEDVVQGNNPSGCWSPTLYSIFLLKEGKWLLLKKGVRGIGITYVEPIVIFINEKTIKIFYGDNQEMVINL